MRVDSLRLTTIATDALISSAVRCQSLVWTRMLLSLFNSCRKTTTRALVRVRIRVCCRGPGRMQPCKYRPTSFTFIRTAAVLYCPPLRKPSECGVFLLAVRRDDAVMCTPLVSSVPELPQHHDQFSTIIESKTFLSGDTCHCQETPLDADCGSKR